MLIFSLFQAVNSIQMAKLMQISLDYFSHKTEANYFESRGSRASYSSSPIFSPDTQHKLT